MIGKVKVLVVDDSAFMRKMLSDILNSDDEIEVVGTAKDGVEAIDKTMQLRPDVITLDIEMPRMDGLTALYHIMNKNPTPVLMISAMNKRDADVVIKSMEYGAVDYIPKTFISPDIGKIEDEILSKVKMASKVKVSRIQFISRRIRVREFVKLRPSANKLVVIGASTGGPQALIKILSSLPEDFDSGIIIVQHMPPPFTASLAERLNSHSALEVKEAEDSEVIISGKIYIAPGDFHTVVKSNRGKVMIKLEKTGAVSGHRPSVDVVLRSAADVYADNLTAVILTGMGKDGAEGVKDVKTKGGRVIAQDESSSAVFGMPNSAIKTGMVDKILPLEKIIEEILKW